MGPMPTPTGYSVQPSPGAGFNHLYNNARPGGQVPKMPPGPGGWGAPAYGAGAGYAQPPPYGGNHHGAYARPPAAYGGAPGGNPHAAGFPPPPGGGGFPQPPAPKQDIPDAPNSTSL